MSALICRRCHKGLLSWVNPADLDRDNWGEKAKMKCEKCGRTTTMKRYTHYNKWWGTWKRIWQEVNRPMFVFKLYWRFGYRLEAFRGFLIQAFHPLLKSWNRPD